MVTVYGIATCDTCKKARAWLEAHGLVHSWVDMRATKPEATRVARWVKALGAKALRNTSGGSYRALGATKDAWGEAEWLAAFQRDAMLIKRPVIEADSEPVCVGFDTTRLSQLK